MSAGVTTRCEKQMGKRERAKDQLTWNRGTKPGRCLSIYGHELDVYSSKDTGRWLELSYIEKSPASSHRPPAPLAIHV